MSCNFAGNFWVTWLVTKVRQKCARARARFSFSFSIGVFQELEYVEKKKRTCNFSCNFLGAQVFSEGRF